MSWTPLEEAIVARLQDRLGATVKRVYTTAEYADVEEESQLTPAVGVVYQGYAPVSTPGQVYGAKVQQIEQTFYVVVAVRNARNTRTRDGAREASAPLVKACLNALIGWRPPDLPEEGPLQLAPAPGAAFTDAGFAYYPIAFINRRTERGTD
jgi:hypothetical protein